MTNAAFSGSYCSNDVVFLLKPVAMPVTDIDEKEALIQSGKRHYSEMLSAESVPDLVYLDLYHAALERNEQRLADDVNILAALLDARAPAGRPIVLLSLVRAGTPVGILLKRALKRLDRTSFHYSISIIRDKGIDRAAMDYVAARHDPADIIFVDGWTGKGAIASELRDSLSNRPHGIAPVLAVLADPAGQADISAGHDDYLIASGLLNAIISGLISRSILNDDVVKQGDFHACVHFDHLAKHDISRAFVDRIDGIAARSAKTQPPQAKVDKVRLANESRQTIEMTMQRFGIRNANLVKPGIAEATRAVLRRVPHRVLVRDLADPDTAHLSHLAQIKGVTIEQDAHCGPYRAITIIKPLGPNEMDGI